MVDLRLRVARGFVATSLLVASAMDRVGVVGLVGEAGGECDVDVDADLDFAGVLFGVLAVGLAGSGKARG